MSAEGRKEGRKEARTEGRGKEGKERGRHRATATFEVKVATMSNLEMTIKRAKCRSDVNKRVMSRRA